MQTEHRLILPGTPDYTLVIHFSDGSQTMLDGTDIHTAPEPSAVIERGVAAHKKSRKIGTRIERFAVHKHGEPL